MELSGSEDTEITENEESSDEITEEGGSENDLETKGSECNNRV